jgi:hypothetical protein
VGASVGERGNVQTRGGNRVSTISLLGCTTSVALTMGPTDEEEESHRGHGCLSVEIAVCCQVEGSATS